MVIAINHVNLILIKVKP